MPIAVNFRSPIDGVRASFLTLERNVGYLGQVLESQEEVLECSNTYQDQVLESYANSLLLEWYP